jgi:hypothetical protein
MHKQLETMKTKGFTTSEIRKDIQAMESEQESVQRKIEKLKQKVQNTLPVQIIQYIDSTPAVLTLPCLP